MTDTLPYHLQKYDNGLGYFETDHGLIYTYGFEDVTASVIEYVSPVLGSYDMTFHYFAFTPGKHGNLEPDPRIVPTIDKIAINFFQDNAKVMLYVCDSMDGRSAARQRLFNKWADTNKALELTKVNIAIGDDDMIYCGVVTRTDFERKDILEQEFIEKSPNIFTQKF